MHAENLDLTAIADLVDTTLHVLDDAMLPVTNRVLELLDAQEALKAVTDTTVTTEDRKISYTFCQYRINSINSWEKINIFLTDRELL